MQRLSFWFTLILVLSAAALVFWRLDLRPEVSSDFFFSSDDPQLKATERIESYFPSQGQILINAVGEIDSTDYLQRLVTLTETLEALDGVAGVNSLARGPMAPNLVPDAPMWSRLLLSRPPSSEPPPNFSMLIVTLDEQNAEGSSLDGSASGDVSALVARIEEIVDEQSAPSFALRLSGVPFVVEKIRSHLESDLRWFSGTAFVIFGLLIVLVYRSWRIALGTLLTCASAAFLTLAALNLIGLKVGILTANLLTIVFVLTLSHVVFLTANWRRYAAEEPDGAVEQAVRITFQASFWSMVTTVLGFGSLLFASAKPLRELGVSGAVGSLMAIWVAYLLYPVTLRGLRPQLGSGFVDAQPGGRKIALSTTVVLVLATIVALFGLPKVDTDPGLFSYFKPDGEIRQGLEQIDREGGSSPLLLVARAPEGETLVEDRQLERLAGLQKALEKDPAVGSAVSLPILLDEARRNPLAVLLSREKLLDFLDTDAFGKVTSQFVTEDRQRGLFFLRLREGERSGPRQEVVSRLVALSAEYQVEIELVGGLYELQGQLGDLVASSLVTGLSGLFGLFLIIAFLVTRSPRSTLAMVVTLAMVPILLLGFLGHLGQPLDVISSPAANLAIALGIDSMIHLVVAVRRRREAGESETVAWSRARGQMRLPIAGAALTLAAGFGLFSLSSFPPTERFGLLVAFGTVLAAILAFEVLPFLAGAFKTSKEEAA